MMATPNAVQKSPQLAPDRYFATIIRLCPIAADLIKKLTQQIYTVNLGSKFKSLIAITIPISIEISTEISAQNRLAGLRSLAKLKKRAQPRCLLNSQGN
jgi:hypothetical protein